MWIDTMFARDMYQVYEINDDLFIDSFISSVKSDTHFSDNDNNIKPGRQCHYT